MNRGISLLSIYCNASVCWRRGRLWDLYCEADHSQLLPISDQFFQKPQLEVTQNRSVCSHHFLVYPTMIVFADTVSLQLNWIYLVPCRCFLFWASCRHSRPACLEDRPRRKRWKYSCRHWRWEHLLCAIDFAISVFCCRSSFRSNTPCSPPCWSFESACHAVKYWSTFFAQDHFEIQYKAGISCVGVCVNKL